MVFYVPVKKNMKSIYIVFILVLSCISLSAQNKKATPKEGEGTHAFLRRNNCTGSEDYNKFIELNKGKFGKDNSLLKGVSYKLPAASNDAKPKKKEEKQPLKKEKRNKLFGSKYQDYTIKSDKLKGACFYLCSGHGGPDPGAPGVIDGHKIYEDEYAYDITLRLARALLEEGATVHIIIQDAKDGIRDDRYLKNSKTETCMGKTIPLNQNKRLKQRSDKINSLARNTKEKYKRSVFIHLDSRSRKQQLDVFFYHAPKSSDSKKLANTMRRTFSEHYDKHQPNRGFSGTVEGRSLYVLNNTTTVGIYAELGNIQNSFDQRRFLDPNNRQALANWICRGVIKDYENRKKGE